ncbi:hypothetical protein CBF45_10160 [Bordetella sp. J329]|nr:hypothetical protein CBF45_10160 [Bordetella sp. J329]
MISAAAIWLRFFLSPGHLCQEGSLSAQRTFLSGTSLAFFDVAGGLNGRLELAWSNEYGPS